MPTCPHLLLITADQMRWDCLGCMGNPVIRTPALDSLAARGVCFRNGFTPNPICVPARASIMTGNYPQVCTGHKGNQGRIRDGQPLLTEVLKRAGYRAYAVGKLHFVPYSPPGTPRLVHGFEAVDLTESGRMLAQFDPQGGLSGVEDYVDYLRTVGWPGYSRGHGVGNNDVRPCPSPLPAAHHVDHWIADCAIRRLERHAAESPDRPFFLWMSSPKPHSPYDPPRPYDALYDPRALPRPFGLPEHLADRDPGLDRTRFTHAITSLSPAAWQVIRSYYYGSITFLDAMIGRVLDHLERMGQLDRTLILFTADHGDLLGDFGACFKSNHLNGSVRVPFLAAGPGVTRGGASDALVGLQDVLPTFAAAAGADVGQPVHGLDLAPALASPCARIRDRYYSTTRGGSGQTAMVTDGRWKYIYTEGNGTEELYDQSADPRELVNLAAPRLSGSDDPCAPWRETLRACAEQFQDRDLLRADGFARAAVDRESFRSLPPSGMGWRWY